jgi:hypothetical protein
VPAAHCPKVIDGAAVLTKPPRGMHDSCVTALLVKVVPPGGHATHGWSLPRPSRYVPGSHGAQLPTPPCSTEYVPAMHSHALMFSLAAACVWWSSAHGRHSVAPLSAGCALAYPTQCL